MDSGYGIYIPSRQRPKNRITKWLAINEVPATFVVEKEDYQAYAEISPSYHTIRVLPESNMGLGYARHWIQINSKERYFAMFDDDLVLGIQRSWSEKGYWIYDRKVPRECIEHGFSVLKEKNLGALGCEYIAFACRSKVKYTQNRGLEGAVFYDKEKFRGALYGASFRLHEDRDFMLQLLNLGASFLISNVLSKDTGRSCQAGASGGCATDYKNDSRNLFLRRLQEKWGKEQVRLVQDKHGLDSRINYDFFFGTR